MEMAIGPLQGLIQLSQLVNRCPTGKKKSSTQRNQKQSVKKIAIGVKFK